MQEIDPIIGLRMIGDGSVVLVSTRQGLRPNIAPVSWHMPVSQHPTLVGIALAPCTQTCHNIQQTGEFILSVPDKYLLREVHWAGRVSGRFMDKIRLLELNTTRAKETSPLLLSNCIGHLECFLRDIQPIGDHKLIVGEVASAQVDEELFDKGWDAEAQTLHHLGGDRYLIGMRVEQAGNWQPQVDSRPPPPLFPDSDVEGDRPRPLP